MENPIETLSNGVVIDPKTKRFLTPPTVPGLCNPETRKKALEAKRRNKALAAKGALRGIVAAANRVQPDITARIVARRGTDEIQRPDDAVEAITETLVSDITLNQEANEGARVKAWEFAVKHADLAGAADTDDDSKRSVTVNILCSEQTLDHAVSLLPAFSRVGSNDT